MEVKKKKNVTNYLKISFVKKVKKNSLKMKVHSISSMTYEVNDLIRSAQKMIFFRFNALSLLEKKQH